MENTNIVKFNGKDTYEPLADLANAVLKAVPNIVLKHGDISNRSIDKMVHPDGVVFNFMVYHTADLNNHIGRLTLEQWNCKTPKFGIQSINIDDGRETWGVEGQAKTSIHAKNIVRVAKKVFKPFTFDQIAKKNYENFSRKLQSISHSMMWEMRSRICSDYDSFLDDFYNMHETGYTPKSPKVKAMIDYVVQNKEKIDKYHNYNPEHYFVLVKHDQVQYALRKGASFGEPTTIANKDELPDEIKGKLFVLDITEGKDFVEDIGLKENDGAYWIIA